MKKIICAILLLASIVFSSVDAIVKTNKDEQIYKATFYTQCELPGGIDPGAEDSLGVSHVYAVLWRDSNNFYFKTDILVGNLTLEKEKLFNKIEEIEDIKNMNLEKLNESPEGMRITELVFE